MALTQAQQDRIDAAILKVNSANAAYNSSLTELTVRDGEARREWTSLNQCRGFLGTIKNYEPQAKATCKSCTLNANCPDCQSKAECEARVIRFNNALSLWSGYKSTVALKLRALNEANQAHLDVLEAIRLETLTDPAAQAEIAAAIAAAQEVAEQAGFSKRVKYIIIGVSILAVIVLIYVYWRYFRK